jgi:hypothetical protein
MEPVEYQHGKRSEKLSAMLTMNMSSRRTPGSSVVDSAPHVRIGVAVATNATGFQRALERQVNFADFNNWQRLIISSEQ